MRNITVKYRDIREAFGNMPMPSLTQLESERT